MSRPVKHHSNGIYVGESLDLAQQISNLRVLGETRLLRNQMIGGGLAVLAGSLWCWLAWGGPGQLPALFLVGTGAVFSLVVAFGRAHIRRAAAATRGGRREPATILLQPGVDDAEREALHGELRPASPHARRWHMQFGRTNGWRPGEGELQVEAVYLSDVAWPVLLIHPDGLLIPAGRPRPVA